MTTSAAAPHNKQRLVLTVYRNLMRWCRTVPSDTLPLDDFIPPMKKGDDEVIIDNVKVFRQVLRASFRDELVVDDSTGAANQQKAQAAALTKRVQLGMDGWRQLNSLQPEIMAFHRQWGASIRRKQEQATELKDSGKTSATLREQDRQKVADYFDTITGGYNEDTGRSRSSSSEVYQELDFVQSKLDAVPWLPQIIEDCEPMPLEIDDDKMFPMFPLASGPLFSFFNALMPSKHGEKVPLPLFTPQRETPIPGAEVNLKIFEPRYRQLYCDLQQSGRRQMIIPFPHPFSSGVFASVALVHHLTHLQEIADETNGTIQYLADHVVVSPVKVHQILNPHVWATQETYLQVQADFLVEDSNDMAAAEGGAYAPLIEVLNEWKTESSHPLASKSILALKEHERMWDFVEVWNKYFQQELFQLQLGVASRVKTLNATFSGTGSATERDLERMTLEAQEPHRRRLVQLMMETSLLVPTLLGMKNDSEKCQYLVKMVSTERDFLKSNSY